MLHEQCSSSRSAREQAIEIAAAEARSASLGLAIEAQELQPVAGGARCCDELLFGSGVHARVRGYTTKRAKWLQEHQRRQHKRNGGRVGRRTVLISGSNGKRVSRGEAASLRESLLSGQQQQQHQQSAAALNHRSIN